MPLLECFQARLIRSLLINLKHCTNTGERDRPYLLRTFLDVVFHLKLLCSRFFLPAKFVVGTGPGLLTVCQLSSPWWFQVDMQQHDVV